MRYVIIFAILIIILVLSTQDREANASVYKMPTTIKAAKSRSHVSCRPCKKCHQSWHKRGIRHRHKTRRFGVYVH